MNKVVEISSGGAVTELIPDRLYAVTAWHPLKQPLSFMPAEFTGSLPLNLYVLKEKERALIIDTGAGAYADLVRAGLEVALEGTTHRTLWISRREFDGTTNMPWLVPAFDIDVVKCGGDFDPNDFFASFDDANATAQLQALAPSSGLIKEGDTLEIGDLTLTAHKTALQVLRTFWFSESATGTLFASDAFVLPIEEGADPDLVADAGSITADRAYAYLSTRFSWLRGAETDEVARDVRAAIVDGNIQRLCPAWGQVIEGRENVLRAVDALCAALDRLGAEKYRPLVTDQLIDRLSRVPGVAAETSPPEG